LELRPFRTKSYNYCCYRTTHFLVACPYQRGI